MAARIKAHEEGAWVRDAASAFAKKRKHANDKETMAGNYQTQSL
jgi:hypothetical protein